MITTDRALFRDALPNAGRLIGLDVGTQTIGTALCDAGGTFASAAPRPKRGRLIGRDPGTKTIGTALCDAGCPFASPALLIRRTKFQKDKTALAAFIAEQQVKGIVIGLPLNLTDGSESPRSQSSRAFARNME